MAAKWHHHRVTRKDFNASARSGCGNRCILQTDIPPLRDVNFATLKSEEDADNDGEVDEDKQDETTRRSMTKISGISKVG